MILSVFTPTHRGGAWLLEAWRSLTAQTYQQWQWVIVPNGGADVPEEIAADARVRVVRYPEGAVVGVGALKRFATRWCTGNVLVELDDDDLLTPDCLAEVAATFADPTVHMAYSNTIEFEDGSWEPHTYSEWYGWQTRPFEWEGHALRENVAWEPGPHSFRHIWWGPNHVRAWRAASYEALGGHDASMAVADDHDLSLRFYLAYGAAGIRHIDKPLYLYRVHGESTCKRRAGEIQQADATLYDRRILGIAQRWARDNGLGVYDLGGGFDPAPGMTVVDRHNADVVADLDGDWPIADGSAGVLRASHVFEHLRDPIHAMNEVYRCLAPGGFAFIEVPSTDGGGAWQDPTHVSFWNENSFAYYTRREYARYLPGFRGRFQVSLLRTVPLQSVTEVPVAQAHLIALKPGYEERRAGEILI